MRTGGGSEIIKMLKCSNPKCVEVHLGSRLVCFFDKGVATQHPQNPSTQVIRQGTTITGYVYSPDIIEDK